jgi:hypothetical protein
MIIGIVASFTFLVGGIFGLIAGYETGWHARDMRMAFMKEENARLKCCLTSMKIDNKFLKEQEKTQ